MHLWRTSCYGPSLHLASCQACQEGLMLARGNKLLGYDDRVTRALRRRPRLPPRSVPLPFLVTCAAGDQGFQGQMNTYVFARS